MSENDMDCGPTDTRTIRCTSCHGTGGDGGYTAGIHEFPCEVCDGWGRVAATPENVETSNE